MVQTVVAPDDDDDEYPIDVVRECNTIKLKLILIYTLFYNNIYIIIVLYILLNEIN